MKTKISLNIIFVLISTFILSGCYTDTVDSLSTFKFQLPVNFNQTYLNRRAPDTSYDFTNLENYQEYRDNKERIKKAEILAFNYWMDSLNINGYPFQPWNQSNTYYYDYTTQKGNKVLQFNFIRFYLVFAKPSTSYPGTYVMDPSSKWHLLGEFKDVNIANYYKMPQNILQVTDETMQVLSDAIKARPQFFTVTEYSNTLNGEKFFDYVKSGHTFIFRFEVDL